MLTVDVEAQPERATSAAIDKLIWGRFDRGTFGIAEMMTAAERHGAKLVMFLDYAEHQIYGESLLDVAREIRRRGHDLQLHLHQDYLSDEFHSSHGIRRVDDMRIASIDAARAYVDFLCEMHICMTGTMPIAYRGGGYRFSPVVLRELARNQVSIDSSYNVSRDVAPLDIGARKQFGWDCGVTEVPISNVHGFLDTDRFVDYNFNASILFGKSPTDSIKRHEDFLKSFYLNHGIDAIAVLVMHSWSLLDLAKSGHYEFAGSGGLERFEALLEALSKKVDFVTSPDVHRMIENQEIQLEGLCRFEGGPPLIRQGLVRYANTWTATEARADTLANGTLSSLVRGLFDNAQTAEGKKEAPLVNACPICGTPRSLFKDFNGPARLCPGCGSVERERIFAHLYQTGLKERCDLAGKRVLLVGPADCETRLLRELGVGEIVTADIRPELKPDLLVDICDMPQVPAESFDAVVGSYVLTCVYDVGKALSELARVLRPSGVLLTSDPLTPEAKTTENTTPEEITAWYGKSAYERYSVGSFRRLGELDAAELISKHFDVEAVKGTDVATGASAVWHVSRKALKEPKPSESPSTPVTGERSALYSLVTPGIHQPERSDALRVANCPICSDPLQALDKKENCKSCGSRPRLRSLAPLLPEILAPLRSARIKDDLPLLSFAMTTGERKLLETVFPKFKSVSLYGNYGSEHESGVDARDLSRFPADTFAGHFSVLLFDYFEEHDAALKEAYRVIAPGGLLITHIAQYRLSDDMTPATTVRVIQSRQGYMDYVPKEVGLPDVKVGRRWFLDALRRAGFQTRWVQVEDLSTGLFLDWFIGVKPPQAVKPAVAGTATAFSGGRQDPLLSTTVAGSSAAPLWTIGISTCPFCGTKADPSNSVESCPGCGSAVRTRALDPILTKIVGPVLSANGLASLPLLAFAVTSREKTLLDRFFTTYRSVSLYGIYLKDHEVGVDARDLTRYRDGEFGGHFGIGLFDYFVEHEEALREAFRVIAAGGFFLTAILPYRLIDGNTPPISDSEVRGRPGYFEYLPDGVSLPSVKVGREWFVDAMRRVGFHAHWIVVQDAASGESTDWFLGIKPGHLLRSEAFPQPEILAPTRGANPSESSVQAPALIDRRKTPFLERTFSTPLDAETGYKRVTVKLTVPSLPIVAGQAEFAAHPFRYDSMSSTSTVYGTQQGGLAVTEDLGEHWDYIPIPEANDVRLFNAFGLADGSVLLQGLAPDLESKRPRSAPLTPIFVCDSHLRVVDKSEPSACHWHGTRSIDEFAGVVIFAEYPDNKVAAKRSAGPERGKGTARTRYQNSSVFRSTDGGRSWAKVFEKERKEIRHFHTAAADPTEAGVWYISSGDEPVESRVWKSVDHGLTWADVTAVDPDVRLHPSLSGAQAIHRYTDIAILPDRLIWGTDDMLGSPGSFRDQSFPDRVGSRVIVSPKTTPLQPRSVGFIGSHVRSIIDVGPAYLLLTEAKFLSAVPRPQVCLLSKTEPYVMTELFTVDRFRNSGTGFSYSRSSRAAKDGRFFTYRDSKDVFPTGVRILQWDIEFE
jgi:ubiquinone/menaquinone biosynthesis C-methylase UbiE